MLTDDREFLYQIKPQDEEVYRCVLPPHSLLLDTLEQIDWTPFEVQLAHYYNPKLGQPGYPPLRLLKIELLKHFYNLADAPVIERCWTDLTFRYFLQLSITAPLPDPSTLTRFRGRIGAEGFQKLFDQLVSQARAAGLVKDRLRLKDASHIYAAVAIPTTLRLVAQLRDRMLAAIKVVDPEIAAGFEISMQAARLDTELAEDPIRLQARVELVTSMWQWIGKRCDEVDRTVLETPSYRRLTEVAALAEKILGDLADPNRGDRTRSVVDPEVRRGKHGKFFDGYLLDVMIDADSEIITGANVLPANGDEAADAITLIEAEQQAHDNQIEQLSIDGIGFNGAVLEQLEDPAGLAIDVITPPKEFNASPGYPASDFELCEGGDRVKCPAREISSAGTDRKESPHSTFFQFSAATCRQCPLVAACHPSMKERGPGRRVNKNRYEAAYRRAREKATTPGYAEVRRRHPAIERKLNELARHHHGRRASYWGRKKVQIQQLLTAMVVNLKRMAKLLRGGELAMS